MNEAGEVPPLHPNPEAARKTANTGANDTENPNKINQYTITAEETKRGIVEKGDLLARMEREGMITRVDNTRNINGEIKNVKGQETKETTGVTQSPISEAKEQSLEHAVDKATSATEEATTTKSASITEKEVKPVKTMLENTAKTDVENETKENNLTEKEKGKKNIYAKKILAQIDEELENKRDHAENENEKAMLDALKNRWKFGEAPEKIIEDFEKLKTNSPEQLMKELLKSRIRNGKRVYEDAKIDALFADKSEGSFYKRMEQEVILQVLQRGILEKGLTREDVVSVENAQWSKDIVEKAFQKNEKVQKSIEKIAAMDGEGTGKITQKELIKKFWENAKKRPGLLILVFGLIGGIPGAAIGAFVLASRKKSG